MDARSLLVEAIVAGEKGYYECPLQLRLYGTNDPDAREQLLARMRESGLPASTMQGVKKEVQQRQKDEKHRHKVAVQAARQARGNGSVVVSVADVSQRESGLGEFAGGPTQGVGPGPSLADIEGASERFNPRIAEQYVEEFGVKEKDLVSFFRTVCKTMLMFFKAAMPKSAQPDALSTSLHDFQLQGLHWMLAQETPCLPALGTKDVVQLWQRHPRTPNAFTNMATNFSVTDPKLASGGILADDMGLGKTIQTISLIMADRQLGRRAPDASNATLILAPVSVMSNWSTQIKKHVKDEHALRIMFYHGTRKQPLNAEDIEKYDVVISTYDSVSSEWHSQNSAKVPRKSGVFSFKWRRVILDEGRSKYGASLVCTANISSPQHPQSEGKEDDCCHQPHGSFALGTHWHTHHQQSEGSLFYRPLPRSFRGSRYIGNLQRRYHASRPAA
jgi:SWI/SNF-related matrix-associated actin-dependent regulator of chromatin subfamily A3